MVRKLCLVVLFGLVGLTAACNTIEGAGRDIRNTGDAISGGARDVKSKL
ncbi:entericidin A/B family lipoprotein [Zavarzinia sp.]